jgi:glutathione synthase/RimK-type ligase-like ATP-grasp enzyme
VARFDAALLTTAAYLTPPPPGDWYTEQIHEEERLLAEALERFGLRVVRADWSDPDFDWTETRCAVFRSTWDYFHRPREFSEWLARAESATTLINNAQLIRWNMDKHYLQDLERAGVEVVPTLFIEQNQAAGLAALAREAGWNDIVLKPAVSGAGRLTFRASGDDIAQLQSTLDECLAAEAMLIQPFQPQILDVGEISLVVIGGRVTHAIRKTARAGDFRVQDDHGGRVHPHAASPAQIRYAQRAVAACPQPPLYARVDIVDTPAGCRLMELELIEPELFFRFHPPAAGVLAQTIVAALATEARA